MDNSIFLTFIPLIGWALGDFFIQRASRKIGVMESLFFICALSVPIMFPFVHNELLALTPSDIIGLLGLSFLTFIYAIVLFKAFQVSKLSVVESVVALELPITVGLSVFIGKEILTTNYLVLFIIICVGVFLAATKSFHHLTSFSKIFEKGVLLAICATTLSAMTNFYTAIASQTTGPLLTIWFIHVVIGLMCFVYLLLSKNINSTIKAFKENKKNVFLMSFFDNLGWFGYAYAVTVLPISLVITVSEGYIILAAFLGYYFNKEKLSLHQKFGAVIALGGLLLLIYII